MKKIVITIATALAFSSCTQIAKEERVLVKNLSDSLLVINVPKASCENCQNVVEGGLSKVNGVKQSILNLHTKQVSIVYNPSVIKANELQIKTKSLINEIPCK
ncbi:MAG: heavy-metal-associated domain-containing protein [Bacteroidota bacterium]